jgi:integrase
VGRLGDAGADDPGTRKHALTSQQCQMLLANLQEPVRTIALVGILAGLRIGEILGLSWEDVNFAAKTIRIEDAVYRGVLGTLKTKGSRRTFRCLNRFQRHSRAIPTVH